MSQQSVKLGPKCKTHVPLDGNPHNVTPGEGTVLEIEHFIRCVLFGWWPIRKRGR